MRTLTRLAVPLLAALALVLVISAASADTKWPSLMRYTISLSTAEDAHYQASLGFSGPIAENMSAKVEGWWVVRPGDDRAFVGDAYVDYTRRPVYLAAGRKFVMFGPVGVLVSPGMFGGHLKLDVDRWDLQVLAGNLQFTPGTSTTRFNFFGVRSPSDERVTAVRLGAPLTGADAPVPVRLGVNWIDVLDDTGSSIDVEIDANKWFTLYGEAADYGDENASAYGIRWSDAKTRSDGKVWIVVFYHRDVDIGFVPAAVGASVFFENQRGWAGGLYHQFDMRHGIGVFADNRDAILTWFESVPL
jgi:hypothetical protein